MIGIRKSTLGELCTIEKGATGILKAIPGKYPLVVTGEERKSHNQFQFEDDAVIIPLVSGTGHGHFQITVCQPVVDQLPFSSTSHGLYCYQLRCLQMLHFYLSYLRQVSSGKVSPHDMGRTR